MSFGDLIGVLIGAITAGGLAGGTVVWLAKTVITERVKSAIQFEYTMKLESQRSELRQIVDTNLELHRAEVREKDRIATERWTLKRDACLRALDVVDRAMSNMEWRDPRDDKLSTKVVPQAVEASEARDAMNRLALSCDDPEIIVLYLSALGMKEPGESGPTQSADAIVDLRSAIRRELGFGEDLALDRSMAWIANIHSRPKTSLPS